MRTISNCQDSIWYRYYFLRQFKFGSVVKKLFMAFSFGLWKEECQCPALIWIIEPPQRFGDKGRFSVFTEIIVYLNYFWTVVSKPYFPCKLVVAHIYLHCSYACFDAWSFLQVYFIICNLVRLVFQGVFFFFGAP